MEKTEISDMVLNEYSSIWKHQLAQGILFVLLGAAVLIYPQLFFAMVASFFVVIGVTFVSAGLALRRLRRNYHSLHGQVSAYSSSQGK